ncbi:hypothetical protein V501_06225 [Pseudogymnoascus sp. VKM F-4519 (FW-2642)]|nr:hypothetical protein V501_06225 [Pseudogymnoascus sp. VKM F-4519 (FW-2642)]
MRNIITKQSHRTLPPRKPATLNPHLRQTNPRPITRLSTALRLSRIIDTHLPLLANRRVDPVPAARLVGVDELAGPEAGVGVGTGGLVGDAGHVFGAAGDFETAGTAEVGGCGEGEDEGGEG